MTDLISGGPRERPVAGWASRPVVRWLALGATIVTTTWVVVHGASTSRAPAAARAVPVAEPSTAPGQPAATAPPPSLRAQLSGVSVPGPPGLRLLVGGPALTVVDTATGLVRPVAGITLPPARWITQLVALGGGTLVVAAPLDGSTEAASVYLVRPRLPTVDVGRADEIVSGPPSGGLWAFTYPRQSGGPATLAAVTPGGRLLTRRVLPEGWHPEADTGNGLLVTAYGGEGPGDLSIVDPISLRVRQSLGQTRYMVAATWRQAAWAEPKCGETCDLIVVDLRSRRRRTVGVAAGFSAAKGAFSPDGRRLAITYYGRHRIDGSAAPGFVEVLDIATGRRTRVPGVGTPPKQAADVSWSTDGRWLALGVRLPGEGYQRVGVWPLSGGPVRVVPGRLPGGYLSALLASTTARAAP